MTRLIVRMLPREVLCLKIMEKTEIEEPEEGEIIDEDVFEVISENSLTSSPISGKSVPRRDLLRAVSLSSISDSDSDVYSSVSSNKHHHKRKRNKSPSKKRKKLKKTDDFGVNLQKQFEKAIKIDSDNDLQPNSLENRLKSMMGMCNNGTNMITNNEEKKKDEEDDELKMLRELALLSKEKPNGNCEEGKNGNNKSDVIKKDDDEELFQLRLDALKSAMLKKAAERKKKREINRENDVDKENNKVLDQTDRKETKKDEENNKEIDEKFVNNSIEEDVDIMRAMLLVSMSNKVIKTNPAPITVKKPPQKPVKKLIINLNDSDDSDLEEIKSDFKEVKTQNNQTDTVKETNNPNDKIEEFLKMQRAEVESKKAKESQENSKSDDSKLDKSVVKLLPKSQQREYQLLKQKLLNAKRRRLRRMSTKSVVNNNDGGIQVTKSTVGTKSTIGTRNLNGQKMQRSLGEMQREKKNGRFQMKLQMEGKYKALGPLLQKLNQTSQERHRCEAVIKSLLQELQKARDKLHATHQNYTNLIAKLKKAKAAIDRGTTSIATTKEIKHFGNGNVLKMVNNTSTPIKKDLNVGPLFSDSCDISTSDDKETVVAIDNCNNKDSELEAKREEETEEKKCREDVGKYVSPLDTKNSDQINNPLTMYCPFELFGVCKDQECQFNHCSSKE